MDLYLVKGTIKRYDYDEVSEFDDLRLVEADDDHQAGEKFKQFWESKSVQYGTSYSVFGWIEVNGVIR